MSLLIDGFNLIYKFPELESFMYIDKLDEARSGLLNILRSYQRIKKGNIRVVFDGKKEPSREIRSESFGSIDVYYSLDYSADYIIKQFVKKDQNPKMVTVVSSDKDIIAFIKRFGAKSITSERFAEIVNHAFEQQRLQEEKMLEEQIKVNPKITEDEISYWQKLFSQKKRNQR